MLLPQGTDGKRRDCAVNKAYADLLIERPELTLEEVMYLDCIAKRHPERLTSAQLQKLVDKDLIVRNGEKEQYRAIIMFSSFEEMH